ncbi:hypothetical protein WMY93_030601 [Mugilogobius chulae]|uniref:Protein Wnt n=1 Tax=Mugilogobius chulae TaxID=88201 RepID=A0AAW0MVU9_9GOBI
MTARLSRIQLALFFILLCPVNIIGLWWAVGSPLVMDPNSICRKAKRLAGKQAELCQTQPEIVSEVAKGARLGVQDIRETAFVYAITAAGVTHAVTQACSMGDLLQCGCEATRNRAPPRPSSFSPGDGVKWEWGGCGDDVEFGYEKSKQFMDAKRRRGRATLGRL